MQQSSLAARIQRELARQAGIRIVVGEANGVIILSGRVETDADRSRAVQIASSLAPDKRIENSLETERIVAEGIEDTAGVNADELNPDDLAESPPALLQSTGYDASQNGVPLETDEMDVVDPQYEVTADQVKPVEEDPSYFAPTDPVIGTGQEGETTVLGGWTPTSTTSQEVAASAEDNQPGDEALASAITRELHEDAATTALQIDVEVDQGVAHLRGTVTDLIDAENAESVASRVPGVRDVIEELNVSTM